MIESWAAKAHVNLPAAVATLPQTLVTVVMNTIIQARALRLGSVPAHSHT